MKQGLFGFPRPLGGGPFVKGQDDDATEERDWRDMDTDVLDAPDGWDWQIDDEMAHHVWTLTAQSRFVGFDPYPPVLLESFMGFFPNQDFTDSLNNWYYTRKTGQTYDTETTWWQIPVKFREPEGDPDTTDILYTPTTTPHPLRSKLQSQQYTVNGAMFTYEFAQWQGDQPSGFMRIPVPDELLDGLRADLEPTPFEETQFQTRTYRQQFAEGPTPTGTFAHPHFAPRAETTQADYVQLFDTAFEYMKRGVRAENA